MNVIFCRWCTHSIEFCEGKFVDWMHSHNRRERCEVYGKLAEPMTYRGVQAKVNEARRPVTA